MKKGILKDFVARFSALDKFTGPLIQCNVILQQINKLEFELFTWVHFRRIFIRGSKIISRL